MHSDQFHLTSDTVAELVADQFPYWREHPVRPVESHGTVNALFLLGDDVVLRFPLRPSLDPALRDELVEEQEHAHRLAAHVPFEVPEPLAFGEPTAHYPGPWTAYRWIPGDTATARSVADFGTFARDLARFVRAVHGMDATGRGWDGVSRGGPLRGRDEDVRNALDRSHELIDTGRVEQVWERCLATAEHTGPDVWLHADLMPGNLLVRGGRLVSVIDFETVCVGDPAVDLMPAWNLLPAAARDEFQRALDVDAPTWERGRGWAIVQAIVALPYYVETNPVMAETARTTLAAAVA